VFADSGTWRPYTFNVTSLGEMSNEQAQLSGAWSDVLHGVIVENGDGGGRQREGSARMRLLLCQCRESGRTKEKTKKTILRFSGIEQNEADYPLIYCTLRLSSVSKTTWLKSTSRSTERSTN
jgi:hypothetical protein